MLFYSVVLVSALQGATMSSSVAVNTTATTSVGPSDDRAPHTMGELIIGPGAKGEYELHGPNGRIATISAREGSETSVPLPIGSYRLLTPTGDVVATIEMRAGELARFSPLESAAPAIDASESIPESGEPPASVAPVPQPSAVAPVQAPTKKQPNLRKARHAAIGSAFLPGLGQFINRETGKGLVMLGTSFALLGAATMLDSAGVENDGVTPQIGSSAERSEFWRLGTLGAATGALTWVYATQIMDAYRAAAQIERKSNTKHRFGVEVTRMATVGRQVGSTTNHSQPALFRDWNLGFYWQAKSRLNIGISDVSIKTGADAPTSVQGGLRLGYRIVEGRLVWLSAAAGIFGQATRFLRTEIQDSIDAEIGDSLDAPTTLTGVPYLQAEARYFPLPNWYISFMPRISVPSGMRHYSRGLKIPSRSFTMEMGTGVGATF